MQIINSNGQEKNFKHGKDSPIHMSRLIGLYCLDKLLFNTVYSYFDIGSQSGSASP